MNFLDLLDDFGGRRTAGETAVQTLDEIWQDLRPHSEQVISLIIDHDLPSIVTAYQGRGLLQHAVEYLAENYTNLLRRCLQDPFFDIRAFANNNLNRPALEQLFRQTLPCDAIQSLHGDEHVVTRDLLVTFGVPPDAGRVWATGRPTSCVPSSAKSITCSRTRQQRVLGVCGHGFTVIL